MLPRLKQRGGLIRRGLRSLRATLTTSPSISKKKQPRSPLVFPAARAGHVSLHQFRAREWIPSVKAAGFVEGKKATKRIYDCRHSYASFSLAAGISLFSLSRRMGTSVRMIDKTYGHLAHDSEQAIRARLDARSGVDLASAEER